MNSTYITSGNTYDFNNNAASENLIAHSKVLLHHQGVECKRNLLSPPEPLLQYGKIPLLDLSKEGNVIHCRWGKLKYCEVFKF